MSREKQLEKELEIQTNVVGLIRDYLEFMVNSFEKEEEDFSRGALFGFSQSLRKIDLFFPSKEQKLK